MMNKSKKTISLSTFVFILVSFFSIPMSTAMASDTSFGIVSAQLCDVLQAAEKKTGDKKKEAEEEPDCE